MTSEVNIAAASLVVALTALIVASGQLLQALISTAEGYRRCAPSVIGAWAKLRRRRWNWTEFRFEVEYATPHLTVLSPNLSDWETARRIYGPIYDLSSLSAPIPERNEKILKALKATVGFYDSKKAIIDPTSWEQQNVPRDEVRVTWFQLVRDIHTTYDRLWPKEGRPQPGIPAAAFTLRHCNWSKENSPGSGRTHAAIAVRRWNWDFMPVDLLKPLATSTLNNVILFALRLNMKWRVLDQKNSNYQADGDGYAFTSTVVRGLGMTFAFDTLGEHDVHRICAPTQAVEKMLFGIVTGCEYLVKRDFHLVNLNRELDYRSLFAAIGVNNHELEEEMASAYYFEQRNDAIILLSTFLSIEDSPVLFNYFPGWNADDVHSAFHSLDGRLAYVEALEERLHDHTTHRARSTLETVMDTFTYLIRAWKYDIYQLYEQSVAEGDDVENKRAFVKACREIFGWTTDFFRGKTAMYQSQEHHGEKSEKKIDWSVYHEGRTRYMDLVAGHSIMVMHCTGHVFDNWPEYLQTYPGGEERRKAHSELVHWHTDPGFQHKYNYVREYVAHFKHEQFGVVKHLRSKGIEWHEDYIEAAWWVLILRGIVWDMSTNGCGPQRGRGSYVWTNNFVPSAFYDIRTPVWIT